VGPEIRKGKRVDAQRNLRSDPQQLISTQIDVERNQSPSRRAHSATPIIHLDVALSPICDIAEDDDEKDDSEWTKFVPQLEDMVFTASLYVCFRPSVLFAWAPNRVITLLVQLEHAGVVLFGRGVPNGSE
jgi:hypothetical protein